MNCNTTHYRANSSSVPGDPTTLENPNAWWRETAQRLLFERQDAPAVPALRKMVKRGKTPQARLHALWTLAGMNRLRGEDVLAGLKDPVAGVRENAVKLAEQGAAGVPPAVPPLRDALFELDSDSDAKVRFQLAFTLGEFTDPRAVDALITIARRDAADPWTRMAVLSSVANISDQLLSRLLADAKFVSSDADFIRELAQIVGVRGQTPEIQRALTSAGMSGVRPSPGAATLGTESATAPSTLTTALRRVVAGIGEGLKRSGKSLRQVDWNTETSSAIDRLLAQAAGTAADSQAPLDARTAAIQLLAFDDFVRVKTALGTLLDTKQPQEVQRAAVAAIGSFNQPETAPLLLAHWRTGAPAIRAEIVLAMLSGRNRLLPLLQAIESGVIPANQVPFARRAGLLRGTDPRVKELATKLFDNATPGSRKEVVAKYQAALSVKGVADRGRKVFETTCATCHRAGDQGKDVGPNLATIRQWNPEQVLINILDPNREVAPNFVSYTVETKDGRTLDGIIAEEGAASLTLKRAEGVTETVLRRDIAQLTGSGLSLMPEGLENTITVEQMADLIAFLLLPP